MLPEETAKVVRAAFPNENNFMKMRDESGPICEDNQFGTLFPIRGRSAEAPLVWLFITVMKFLENLRNQQAATYSRPN